MTPIRNDDENPFARESVWPTMPQTPLGLDEARPAAARPARELDIDEVMVVAAAAEPEL